MAKAVEGAKAILMCVTEKYRQSLNCQVFIIISIIREFYNLYLNSFFTLIRLKLNILLDYKKQ